MTPLDHAHAHMTAAPDDDGARLRFFERLLDSELVLLLDSEAEGETISPRLAQTEAGAVALAFDTDDRLSAYAGGAAYAALPGRALIEMLAGASLGLAVNLDVAPSAWLLSARDVAQLAEIASQVPEEATDYLDHIGPPEGATARLLEGLGEKLTQAAGLADGAYLVTARSAGGEGRLMLGFVGTAEGAEIALARAAGEALTFTGEDLALDVIHAPVGTPLAGALTRQGVRIEIPSPPPAIVKPEGPPRLR